MSDMLSAMMKGYANRVLGPESNEPTPEQTASAYSQLQQAMNQQYDAQRQQFESNPANSGKQWSAPDPVTRLNDQIDAMIKSGNPALMKRGLELLGTVKPSTAAPAAAIQEYQYATSQGYKGTFADWKAAQKQGTTVNVSTGGRGSYLTPEEKLAGGLDPKAAYVWTNDGPKPVQQSTESAEQKQINVAQTTVSDLSDMLFGDDGIYKDYQQGTKGRIQEVTKANVQSVLQNDPRYAIYSNTVDASLSSLARSIGGEKGALAEGDIARVRSLLPIVTGLNPDTPEVAKQKLKRLENLVELARQKGGLTSEELRKYITGYGGQGKPSEGINEWGVPNSIAKPVKEFMSSGGIKFTVE